MTMAMVTAATSFRRGFANISGFLDREKYVPILNRRIITPKPDALFSDASIIAAGTLPALQPRFRTAVVNHP